MAQRSEMLVGIATMRRAHHMTCWRIIYLLNFFFRIQSCLLSSAGVRFSTKNPPLKSFGGSMSFTGFRGPAFVPGCPARFWCTEAMDAKGRKGRDAGNEGVR